MWYQASKEVDAKCEVENEHPLALLAVDVQALVKKDASLFGPVLSRWHPHAIPYSASLFHNLYQKELVSYDHKNSCFSYMPNFQLAKTLFRF